MVGTGGEAIFFEEGGQRFRGVLKGDVNDGRLAGRLAELPEEVAAPVPVGEGRDHEIEVGTVEGELVMIGRLNLEMMADLGRHPGGGGGRKTEDARDFQFGRETGKLEVVGTKVVTPFRNTVGLVDREESELVPGQAKAELFIGESFRSHEEKFELAVFQSAIERQRFLRGEGGVEAGGGNAPGDQGIDLIFHQGNERRNHQGQALEEEGRELVTQGLATAGGKNGEGRAVGQEGVDDRFLSVPEILMAEVFLEGGRGVHGMTKDGILGKGKFLSAGLRFFLKSFPRQCSKELKMSDHETDQQAASNEEQNNEVNVPKSPVNLPQGFTPLVPRPPIPGGKPPVPGQKSEESGPAEDSPSDAKTESDAGEAEVPQDEVEEVTAESDEIEAGDDSAGMAEDEGEKEEKATDENEESPLAEDNEVEEEEITAEEAPDLTSESRESEEESEEDEESSGEAESPDEEVVTVEKVETVVEEEEPSSETESGEAGEAGEGMTGLTKTGDESGDEGDFTTEGEVDLTGPDVESIFAKVSDEAKAGDDESDEPEAGEPTAEEVVVEETIVAETESEQGDDEDESPEVVEEVVKEKNVEVTFHAPKVQPVRLSAAEVYSASQEDKEEAEAVASKEVEPAVAEETEKSEDPVAAEADTAGDEKDKSILEKLADGELDEFSNESEEDEEDTGEEDEESSEDSAGEEKSDDSAEDQAESDDDDEDEDEEEDDEEEDDTFSAEDQEESSKVPDATAVAALVAKARKSDAEKMEVMDPEAEKTKELFRPEKQGSRWAFWRRSSKRDQQLARISEGYLEMVDLVRAIRSQLESQNENNLILRDSLAHLPEAMKGLDSFSKSQRTVGKALKEIHGQLKKSGTKDQKLVESMGGFNDTLKGMDDTSKATMKTFDRVQERMRDSDIRMENLFQNVQNTEEKVGETMVRLQRNMAIMQSLFLICLMIVIGVLVFTVMGNWDQGGNKEPAPIERTGTKDSETSSEE